MNRQTIFQLVDVYFDAYPFVSPVTLSDFNVDAIMPSNKPDCGQYELGTWAEFDSGEVSRCHYQSDTVTFLNITCQENTVGQYLRIQKLSSTDGLSLCEIEVYGDLQPFVHLGMKTSHVKFILYSYLLSTWKGSITSFAQKKKRNVK